MAEAHQARVQNVVEEMVQILERDNIRVMQAGVFICGNIICACIALCVSTTLICAAPVSIVCVCVFSLQGRMFSCSADCCDRSTDSMSVVHRCIERCHTPLAQAQGLVTSELEKFQDRLSRCTMHCNDKAKDLFDSGAKEPAVRSLMDSCVGSCVDDHINLIPSMTRRIKDNLNSIQQ
ncbi:protein FAM136A isoform X1 [Pseudoliparis swirei]|uniref:protein FAM136A isoform X1 n=1 Tax=Pseudoliparis swirei TaxID=2059687 RepID=UPI0024BD7CC5|nr:protein FAM136A isoform X1 [Pseudoliparis swirei]